MAQSVLSFASLGAAQTSSSVAKTRSAPACLRGLDLNLASLRYQKVLKTEGGPIDHLEEWQATTSSRAWYRFDAFLLDSLRPAHEAGADGSAADVARPAARVAAISDALESWAFWDRSQSVMRDFYGFSVEDSRRGMAAFPGLFTYKAREQARAEALARYAVQNWWEGRLHHVVLAGPPEAEKVLQLELPETREVALLTFHDDVTTGLRTYGCGVARDLATALRRARIERRKHAEQVTSFVDLHPDPELALFSVQETTKRRSLYFALEAGQELFDERLRCERWSRARAPRAVFDGLIPGDWDRFASVWRTLYEAPTDEFASERADYFYW